MAESTIRELRNDGGRVIRRVESGEHLIVTRAGRPVAELHPVRREPVPANALVERWSTLPAIDAAALHADIDAALDSTV